MKKNNFKINPQKKSNKNMLFFYEQSERNDN